MTVVAWIIWSFFAMQFLVALSNLFFMERMKEGTLKEQPLVSILVPARNEEKNIPPLIESLLNQNYPNFELIIFDDQSEDRTAGLVQQYCFQDSRIQLIQNTELPKGWLGKNYACYQLSQKANGKYFLFLDADVQISNNIIFKAVNHMQKNGLSLISVFPKQIMTTRAEKMTVPVMHYILLTLLPLLLVRVVRFASLAAANGQFMFFDAKVYTNEQPHHQMKANKVEDIAIARFFKQKGLKISCQTGYHEVSCRMYSTYFEAVNGFSRNIADYFGGSMVLATLFWFMTTLGPFVLFWKLNLQVAIAGLFMYLFTKIVVAVCSKQPVIENLRYLIQQQWAMGVFIFTAMKNHLKKEQQWKGRNVA